MYTHISILSDGTVLAPIRSIPAEGVVLFFGDQGGGGR